MEAIRSAIERCDGWLRGGWELRGIEDNRLIRFRCWAVGFGDQIRHIIEKPDIGRGRFIFRLAVGQLDQGRRGRR